MKTKKKNELVYLAFYKGNLFGVYRNAAKRREIVKQAVLEGGYLIDKFTYEDQPLI